LCSPDVSEKKPAKARSQCFVLRALADFFIRQKDDESQRVGQKNPGFSSSEFASTLIRLPAVKAIIFRAKNRLRRDWRHVSPAKCA
jgi:hypothetical protein